MESSPFRERLPRPHQWFETRRTLLSCSRFEATAICAITARSTDARRRSAPAECAICSGINLVVVVVVVVVVVEAAAAGEMCSTRSLSGDADWAPESYFEHLISKKDAMCVVWERFYRIFSVRRTDGLISGLYNNILHLNANISLYKKRIFSTLRRLFVRR